MRHIYDRIEPEFVRLVNDEVARDKNKVNIARAASASGDWAHPCHICTGTGLIPPTSAPGLGSSRTHLHRDTAMRRALASSACRCMPAAVRSAVPWSTQLSTPEYP